MTNHVEPPGLLPSPTDMSYNEEILLLQSSTSSDLYHLQWEIQPQ